MTDLRTLLHDAAPMPRHPLDMAAVRRRSQRLGLRRVGLWVGALGVLAGVAVPVAGGLVPSSDPDAGVQVIPGPITTTTSTTTPDLVGPDTDAPQSEASSDSDRPDVLPGGASGASAGSAEATERVIPWSPPTTEVARPVNRADYPAAAECSVDNEGLAAGEQRRCRFTATTSGGFGFRSSGPVYPNAAQVSGKVLVTRDGVTTTYDVVDARAEAGGFGAFVGCDFPLDPGDLVEVVLTSHRDDQLTTTTLGAGDGWAC